MVCHLEAARSLAAEGSVQYAGGADAAGESVGPSARKRREPQDDKALRKS